MGGAVLGLASFLGLQGPGYLSDLGAAGLAEHGQQDDAATGGEPVRDPGLPG